MAKHLKLEDLTKSSVWSLSESDLGQMIADGKKHDAYVDYEAHYLNIIRPVFDISFIDAGDQHTAKKLRESGYEVFSIPSDGVHDAVAIRKHRIKKVTDLTLENVSHLLPSDILQLIESNLGTGWKGLPLAIQDIIESAFYIDCSVMPAASLHRKGGMIERRTADGYEVLEIARGTWMEAIFIKAKPKVERVRYSSELRDGDDADDRDDDEEDDELDDDASMDNDDVLDDEDEEVEQPGIEDIDVIDDDSDDSDD